MYSIEDGERLIRVNKYELYRKHGRLLVDVFEVISGYCREVKFIAIPTLPAGLDIKERVGLGLSNEEALNQCLARTRGLISDTLFPDLCGDDCPAREFFEEDPDH